MLLGAPHGLRPIADRHPRLGQAQHRVRIVGFQLGSAAPPLHRLVLCRRSRRQQAESLSTSFRKAPALVVNPALEPGPSRRKKPSRNEPEYNRTATSWAPASRASSKSHTSVVITARLRRSVFLPRNRTPLSTWRRWK